MEGLLYFEGIASRLDNEEIRAWKESGKRVVGTVCANIPEEILQAIGSHLAKEIRQFDESIRNRRARSVHRIASS